MSAAPLGREPSSSAGTQRDGEVVAHMAPTVRKRAAHHRGAGRAVFLDYSSRTLQRLASQHQPFF